jgi:DNA-binding CsgD family transcriptional regulator
MYKLVNENIMDDLGLTRAQKRVANLVMAGLANEEIAAALDANLKTVKWQLTNIYKVTGQTSRNRLMVALARKGWDFSEHVTVRYTEPPKTFIGGLPRGTAC